MDCIDIRNVNSVVFFKLKVGYLRDYVDYNIRYT